MAKGRDSGMPPTAQWESYFDTAHILDALGVQGINGDAVEFGCGYGTFTTAIAQRISGTVHAVDIAAAFSFGAPYDRSPKGNSDVCLTF